MAENPESAKQLFIDCGFDEKRANDILTNKANTNALVTILNEAKAVEGVNMKEVVNHLYLIATTLPANAVIHRSTLTKYVATNKIGKLNLAASIAYLKKLGSDPLNIEEFEKECGVGVTITRDDVKKAVADQIVARKDDLVAQRYRYPIAQILGAVRDSLKWANTLDIKEEVDAQVKELLGEKTAEDNAKPVKKAAEPKKAAAQAEKKEEPKEPPVRFPPPHENKQIKPEILEAHLKATGGKVICRFPPEPNGYLHIGHTKAMLLDFSYPKKFGGYTILRFDDTNPEAEKLEYIESIISDVEYMGHKPAMVTYSSDYFDKLYDLAVQLIKSDKAYVCHQTGDEIKSYREKRMDSPYRNRPIEESLKLFEDMKNGKFEEGKAILRMKQDMKNDNPCMWDLIAYRIKYTPHPHVGDKWCIYPSYDYTHCIIDSLENVTHSLCTLEFLPRRESYYWLLDALNLYKPLVWEFSRLNLSNLVMSKRRLIRLVKDGIVNGWDDPRLPTIRGLKRRGFTAAAMNDLCERVGVTTNNNLTDFDLLEQCCREDLDVTASRVMVVLDPLKVTITNWEGEDVRQVQANNHPKDKSKGTRNIPMTKTLYIDNSDFRLQDVKGYKRLAPGKTVGLNHVGCAIKCDEVVKDADGKPVELKVTVSWTPEKKPQGYIHWVSEPTPGQRPLEIEARIYDKLFMAHDTSTLSSENDAWMKDINPNSLKIIKGLAESSLKEAKVGESRQFERVGFFCVDPDTTTEKMVWNRVIGLKAAKWEGKDDE
eukprot:TRINITY_DN2495_c0_g1_i1.p1 TRINITY_DN2495_c0_g1~~TRINITY_DN2495_c0_g1_i1.p1  ORF type:complete len:814 (-),score=239.51 TRINITY_DN2495_c0_g1_i1:35-2335(-)